MKTRSLGTFDVDDLAYLKPGHKPLTCISLFTGIGGFDLGFAASGFETRVMVEWDASCCDTLRGNFTMKGHHRFVDGSIAHHERQYRITGDKSHLRLIKNLKRWRKQRPAGLRGAQKNEPVIMQVDITKTTTEEILTAANLRVGEATALTGGFPCQGFSLSNSKRDNNDHTKDKRNFLYKECVRVIGEALPKTFILENVPGLVSMEKGGVIRMICDDLARCGYTVSWQQLNAVNYGVPQHRVRVFIMGNRNDVLGFDMKKKRPSYHIGGSAGPIRHPDWFIKKYKIVSDGRDMLDIPSPTDEVAKKASGGVVKRAKRG